MLTIGSLFSGIGGLELGLERAGLGSVLWQVEIDPFCLQALALHWPDATRHEDVTKVGSATLAPVDLICGGFPCQDVSSAGKGAGLAGGRSGLWFEFARIIGEMRPRWVVVENVASGASRWVDAIMAGLEQLDYQAIPIPLSARDVGAPHRRERIFVVGHADRDGEPASAEHGEVAGVRSDAGASDAERVELRQQQRWRGGQGRTNAREPGDNGEGREVAAAAGARLQGTERTKGAVERAAVCPGSPWSVDEMPEPALHRVDDGLPAWVDRNSRLRALGNAVVPQCAEVIGHIVLQLAEIEGLPTKDKR